MLLLLLFKGLLDGVGFAWVLIYDVMGNHIVFVGYAVR